MDKKPGPLDLPPDSVLHGDKPIYKKIADRVRACQIDAAEHGVLHRGWRFFPPYACGRCGRWISASQFAFSRSCGGCDHSDSRTARLHILERKWFLLGRVVDERDGHSTDINPQFIDAAEAKKYPLLRPERPPFISHKPPFPKKLFPPGRIVRG